MRGSDLTTWLLHGTAPRLVGPVLLIIVLATVLRYHVLLASEVQEAQQRAEVEVGRIAQSLGPLLAMRQSDGPRALEDLLREASWSLQPQVQELRWQVVGEPVVQWAAPPLPAAAPPWFVDAADLQAPRRHLAQLLPDGRTARLTVALQLGPVADPVWRTVVVQARITAINIVVILGLLALLLRANARLLRRLGDATDRFRQGHLDARMPVQGTLEVQAVARTFNDMAGKVQSLVLSLHDTQRQQSEQLHLTRQLLDALPWPLVHRGPDGEVLGTNQAWQQLMQSAGSAAQRLVALQSVRSQLDPGEPVALPLPGQPPRYVACHHAPLRTLEGRPSGTLCTINDVTETVQAQAVADGLSQALAQWWTHSQDPLLAVDAHGQVTAANPAALRLWGAPAEDMVGQPLARLLEPPPPAPEAAPGSTTVPPQPPHPVRLQGPAHAAATPWHAHWLPGTQALAWLLLARPPAG